MAIALVNGFNDQAAVVDIGVFSAVRVALPLVVEAPCFHHLEVPVIGIDAVALKFV